MHAGEVGFDDALVGGVAPEQSALKARFIGHGRPGQTGGAGKAGVLGDDALGDGKAVRYCRVRQTALVLESEDVLDHANAHALLRHRLSDQKRPRGYVSSTARKEPSSSAE